MKNLKSIILLLVGTLCLTSCGKSFWDKLQTIDEGYQNRFAYQGKLEKQDAANGQYQVELFTQEDADERIKLLQVYFPADLKTTQKKWPLVLMANGTGIRASKYKAIFRHLASWGFIVVGNEDEWTWDGKSISKSLDMIKKSAEDAAKEINAQGFDFTAADLAEFAESVQETSGELDEAALEGVSGGGYSWERFKSFWRGFYDGWCAG